ncbi:MAG: hypothetical protein ABUL71_03490, partial [Gemmatimonadota bacterium]
MKLSPPTSGYCSMLHARLKLSFALTAAFAGSLGAQALPNPMPFKYSGPATVPAITAGDLMTRLYKYADDSMMGRYVGSEYHIKATAYIEQEVRKLGLQPGGTNGSFFQDIGVVHRSFDLASTLTVDGVSYKAGVDFLAGAPGKINAAPVLAWFIFDTTTTPAAAQLVGKLVAMRTTPQPQGADLQAFLKTAAYQTYLKVLNGTAGNVGTISVIGDSIPAARLKAATDANGTSFVLGGTSAATLNVSVTSVVMSAILGAPLASVASGTVGKAVTAELRISEVARPGRNVVAILPGSDPKLKGQYVAIGAHNDHVGFAGFGQCGRTAASDSQHVWNAFGRPAGAEGGRNIQQNPITPEEWTTINAKIAELRKTIPERADSICNGADDDGSGSVSVLEIAEAFAKGSVK